MNNEDCVSGTSTRHKGELHLIDVQHLVDDGIEHPFLQLHDYLWAWDHDSYHGQGLHPCPYRGSGWSSPPIYWDHTTYENSLPQFSYQLNPFLVSRFQRLSYDVRRTSSLVVFHLAKCFADLGRRHTGRRASKCKCVCVCLRVCVRVCVVCVLCACVGVGTSDDSLLGHTNSTLRTLAQCSAQAFLLSLSLSSPAALRTQFSPITSWFGWRYRNHQHQLGILWRFPLSLPQTLTARWHALPCTLPFWPQSYCLLSSWPYNYALKHYNWKVVLCVEVGPGTEALAS